MTMSTCPNDLADSRPREELAENVCIKHCLLVINPDFTFIKLISTKERFWLKTAFLKLIFQKNIPIKYLIILCTLL